ncbi:MAG: hypothetical protein ACREMV_03680, partial [Gemmatimonadales bacterium]
AQARYRVVNDGEPFHQEAGGRQLARLARGAIVTVADTQGEWLRVTIEGWVFGASVGPAARPGFDLAVTRDPEENLRTTPDGALVAKLVQGFQLMRVGEDGRWVRVRRDGWVKRDGLTPAAVATRTAADTGAAADTGSGGLTPGPGPGVPDPTRVQAARRTTLFRAPDGPSAGAIDPDAPLRVLSRSGEWARVQFEGWVRSTDLAAAPPGVLLGVSAAELRADPERFRGQVLRWTLQYIALQTADELRPDIPAGATYMLARGPHPERGFVYVVIPETRRAGVDRLAALTTIQVSVRVRAGRSRFLGHPVVDLISLESPS